MSAKKSKQLGRGLAALLGDDSQDYRELDRVRAAKTVAIEHLHPGTYQPRRIVDDAAIEELARSIADKGIIQPIIVRRHPENASAYEIIAGERRWRAAQRAKLHEVPVVVREFTDAEALEVGLIENLQRQDLNPLEEAEGYQRLMQEFSHTQEELAQGIGKSRSHVANTMRLLSLPDAVKAFVEDGRLSAGHARALLGAVDPVQLAKRIVAAGLSVREAEKLAKAPARTPKSAAKAPAKDADTLALERDLTNRLGLRVSIAPKGKGGGTLTLAYSNLDQLDDLLKRLDRDPASDA